MPSLIYAAGGLRPTRYGLGIGEESTETNHTKGSWLAVAEVKVTYDKSVDAAYVYLTEPHARVSSVLMYPCDPADVDGMINLDFDEKGRLIGIEVLAASAKLPEYLLQSAERLDAQGT